MAPWDEDIRRLERLIGQAAGLGRLKSEAELKAFIEQTVANPGLGARVALLLQGSGTPEAAVAAPVGAIFQRLDGGAATSFYVKESGTGNTGWVAK